MGRTGLPSGPSTSTANASVNRRPSWKMCPISMPRRMVSSPSPQAGQGSPARTSAASIVPSGVKSRPHDHVGRVPARLVRPGQPGRCRCTTRGSTR